MGKATRAYTKKPETVDLEELLHKGQLTGLKKALKSGALDANRAHSAARMDKALGLTNPNNAQSEWPPLLFACAVANRAFVEQLLKAGSDPNKSHPCGLTSLMALVLNSSMSSSEKLATAKALQRAGFRHWGAMCEVQGDTTTAVVCAMQQAAVGVAADDADAQAAAVALVEWLLQQGDLPDSHVHTGVFQHLSFVLAMNYVMLPRWLTLLAQHTCYRRHSLALGELFGSIMAAAEQFRKAGAGGAPPPAPVLPLSPPTSPSASSPSAASSSAATDMAAAAQYGACKDAASPHTLDFTGKAREASPSSGSGKPHMLDIPNYVGVKPNGVAGGLSPTTVTSPTATSPTTSTIRKHERRDSRGQQRDRHTAPAPAAAGTTGATGSASNSSATTSTGSASSSGASSGGLAGLPLVNDCATLRAFLAWGVDPNRPLYVGGPLPVQRVMERPHLLPVLLEAGMRPDLLVGCAPFRLTILHTYALLGRNQPNCAFSVHGCRVLLAAAPHMLAFKCANVTTFQVALHHCNLALAEYLAGLHGPEEQAQLAKVKAHLLGRVGKAALAQPLPPSMAGLPPQAGPAGNGAAAMPAASGASCTPNGDGAVAVAVPEVDNPAQAYRVLYAAVHHPDAVDHDLTPLLKHLPSMDMRQALSLLPVLESRNLFNVIAYIDSFRLLGTRVTHVLHMGPEGRALLPALLPASALQAVLTFLQDHPDNTWLPAVVRLLPPLVAHVMARPECRTALVTAPRMLLEMAEEVNELPSEVAADAVEGVRAAALAAAAYYADPPLLLPTNTQGAAATAVSPAAETASRSEPGGTNTTTATSSSDATHEARDVGPGFKLEEQLRFYYASGYHRTLLGLIPGVPQSAKAAWNDLHVMARLPEACKDICSALLTKPQYSYLLLDALDTARHYMFGMPRRMGKKDDSKDNNSKSKDNKDNTGKEATLHDSGSVLMGEQAASISGISAGAYANGGNDEDSLASLLGGAMCFSKDGGTSCTSSMSDTGITKAGKSSDEYTPTSSRDSSGASNSNSNPAVAAAAAAAEVTDEAVADMAKLVFGEESYVVGQPFRLAPLAVSGQHASSALNSTISVEQFDAETGTVRMSQQVNDDGGQRAPADTSSTSEVAGVDSGSSSGGACAHSTCGQPLPALLLHLLDQAKAVRAAAGAGAGAGGLPDTGAAGAGAVTTTPASSAMPPVQPNAATATATATATGSASGADQPVAEASSVLLSPPASPSSVDELSAGMMSTTSTSAVSRTPTSACSVSGASGIASLAASSSSSGSVGGSSPSPSNSNSPTAASPAFSPLLRSPESHSPPRSCSPEPNAGGSGITSTDVPTVASAGACSSGKQQSAQPTGSEAQAVQSPSGGGGDAGGGDRDEDAFAADQRAALDELSRLEDLVNNQVELAQALYALHALAAVALAQAHPAVALATLQRPYREALVATHARDMRALVARGSTPTGTACSSGTHKDAAGLVVVDCMDQRGPVQEEGHQQGQQQEGQQQQEEFEVLFHHTQLNAVAEQQQQQQQPALTPEQAQALELYRDVSRHLCVFETFWEQHQGQQHDQQQQDQQQEVDGVPSCAGGAGCVHGGGNDAQLLPHHHILGRTLAWLAALPSVPPELDVQRVQWEAESRTEYILAVQAAKRLIGQHAASSAGQ